VLEDSDFQVDVVSNIGLRFSGALGAVLCNSDKCNTDR